MKQSILITLVLIGALSVRGQMTQWTIQPKYDQIYVKDKDILQGENNGDNILWTMDGKMLFATPKVVCKCLLIQQCRKAISGSFVSPRYHSEDRWQRIRAHAQDKVK